MAVTRLMRSGKYFLMVGGNSTLPMPIPNSATDVPTARPTQSCESTLMSCPTRLNVRLTIRPHSMPMRRPMRGVTRDATAKHAGGMAPMIPMASVGTENSCWISEKSGESEPGSVRRLNATMTMPMSASVRPAHTGRGASFPAISDMFSHHAREHAASRCS